MDEPKRSPTTQAGNDELWRIHAERYRRLYGSEPPPVEAPKPPKPKARRPKSRRPAQKQAKPPVAGEPPATFKQIDLLLSLGADRACATHGPVRGVDLDRAPLQRDRRSAHRGPPQPQP